jgi:hypothetical protein
MNSGTDTVWALLLGLMFTVFGGYAFCYGLVMLGEKAVERFHARRSAPVAVPAMRRAA